MNALDKLIGWVSPSAGLERARARLMIDKVRKYDAAAAGRRVSSWIAQGTSANAELAASLPTIRDRHRELVRNNPWAGRAVQAIVSNTVGYGFTAKVDDKKVGERFKRWAESTDCDAGGRHNLAGLTSLIMATVAESGECIIRRRLRRPEDGFETSLQLQVMEPDHLDHGKTEQLASGRIIQGVEFNGFGKRVAYWMYRDHPGGVLGSYETSVRVPASEVLHVYRMERPDQVRGVPWGRAAMISLRDLDDYEDAYLFRQKIANCQVGVVYDNEVNDANVAALAAGTPLGEAFEPGRYEFLPSGKRIEFNKPPDAGDYGPFTKDVLLRVAAAYGITFQALTGDLTSVNFSSGRMGWIEMGKNIDAWRWAMLAPQFLDPVGRWFSESVAPNKYYGFTWTAPRREMLSPEKDIAAYKDAIRSGLMTLPQAHRELGEDSDAILAEIATTNAELDRLSITLDCDPRKTAVAGTVQSDGITP